MVTICQDQLVFLESIHHLKQPWFKVSWKQLSGWSQPWMALALLLHGFTRPGGRPRPVTQLAEIEDFLAAGSPPTDQRNWYHTELVIINRYHPASLNSQMVNYWLIGCWEPRVSSLEHQKLNDTIDKPKYWYRWLPVTIDTGKWYKWYYW